MRILKKRLFIPLLTAVLLLAVISPLSITARALDDPAILAEAALLVDMDTGGVLYSLNESDRRAPASLTKIMTVLLAIEASERGDVSLSDIVTVSDDVYSDIGTDGSSVGLKAGEQLTFENLLYCAMLASANEGCNAIAEAVAGDIGTFVSMMNTRATELGCTSTNFVNTHGMPDDNHYTTAEDLSLITAEAMDHSLFRRIVSTQSYTVPATNLSVERVLRNTNNLLASNSTYYYEYATGVKTGSTDAAGYCLVATATQEGRDLMAVILGAKSVVLEDGRTQVQSFTEGRRLLEWGFENFSYRDLLTTMRLLAEVPVELGLGARSVVLRPEKNVTALLPNDVDLDDVELKTTLYSDSPLRAPVEQGTVLGEVAVSFNGTDYGSVNLIANTKIELDKAAFIGSEIKSTLANKYVRLGITLFVILLILYLAFIFYYNIRRRNKRRVAADLARERVEAYRRSQEPSTGKSFEEIEARHKERELSRK